jgi:peptidoglycan hydrolase-like protein with peptidoglycan-binding domain
MQPRVLLGSTCALVLGLSGLALADDDHPARVTVTTENGARTSLNRAQIVEMQRALISRNLYQGPADGVWGPKTESAVRNFQTQKGIEATGEPNEPTARALGLDMGSMDRQTVSGTDAPAPAGTAPAISQPKIEDASTNVKLESLSVEQARELQQRLQLLGYYRGTVDGKVGEGTRVALQHYFQRQAELARQGVISNATIGMFGTEVNDVPR